MEDASASRMNDLKQLEIAVIALKRHALDLHEPMLVHLFEMAPHQIQENMSSSD